MFFYAGKILWMLLQPSMVIMLAIIGGAMLAMRPHWTRSGKRLFVLGLVGLLVCGVSPLGLILISVLEERFPRSDLDKGGPIAGIIILGGAEDSNVPPEKELANLNDAAERMTEGAALALRLRTLPVVFTGGNANLIKDAPPEADVARRLLIALGIDERRIMLETRARDTFENAQLTKALLNPKPGDRWLLITSAWHMPRSMGSFRKSGFDVEAWPVDYRALRPFTPDLNIAEGLRRMDYIFKEYVGLLAYYLSGRTSALLPRP